MGGHKRIREVEVMVREQTQFNYELDSFISIQP